MYAVSPLKAFPSLLAWTHIVFSQESMTSLELKLTLTLHNEVLWLPYCAGVAILSFNYWPSNTVSIFFMNTSFHIANRSGFKVQYILEGKKLIGCRAERYFLFIFKNNYVTALHTSLLSCKYLKQPDRFLKVTLHYYEWSFIKRLKYHVSVLICGNM